MSFVFLLAHDTVWPHLIRMCRHFWDDQGIDANDWPSHSTEMSPIENLWNFMYCCIWYRQIVPENVQEPPMLWSSRTPFILSSAESPYVGRSYIKTLGRYALLSHIMTQIGSACLVDQLSCFHIWEFYVFSSYKMTVHMDGHWHQAS